MGLTSSDDVTVRCKLQPEHHRVQSFPVPTQTTPSAGTGPCGSTARGARPASRRPSSHRTRGTARPTGVSDPSWSGPPPPTPREILDEDPDRGHVPDLPPVPAGRAAGRRSRASPDGREGVPAAAPAEPGRVRAGRGAVASIPDTRVPLPLADEGDVAASPTGVSPRPRRSAGPRSQSWSTRSRGGRRAARRRPPDSRAR